METIFEDSSRKLNGTHFRITSGERFAAWVREEFGRWIVIAETTTEDAAWDELNRYRYQRNEL